MPANPRQIAWDILLQWKPDGIFAEDLIDRSARHFGLSGPNRGLVSAVVLGVLRHRSVLDLWINHLREGGKLSPALRDLLRMGLAQIFVLGVPDHAAVNETVELAGPARKLVNALMRRALREKKQLLALRDAAPLDIRWSLPTWLLDKWTRAFKQPGAEALAAWCGEPPPNFVRTNRLKGRAASTLAAIEGLERVPEYEDMWLCRELPIEALDEGLCYAQDPSTTLAPRLLAPKPGDAVLDACAAPGGKSALLAQLAENRARLLCVDSLDSRMGRLTGNLRRMGVDGWETMVHDWTQGTIPPDQRTRYPQGFDCILLDVPCSNTGVMRRRVDVRWRLQPERITAMAETQKKIVTNTLPLLKPHGRLCYSTCSLEQEENEGIANWIAKTWPALKWVETKKTLPQRDHVDGSFCALFVKTS